MAVENENMPHNEEQDTSTLSLLLRSSLGLKKRNRLVESYHLALSFTFILSPMRNAAVGSLLIRSWLVKCFILKEVLT